jgi:hypothetical protein
LNLKRLLVGRATPTQLAHREPLSTVTLRVSGLLVSIAVVATLALGVACAVLLWLAPWPVDALAAVVAAAAWASWIDGHEQQ